MYFLSAFKKILAFYYNHSPNVIKSLDFFMLILQICNFYLICALKFRPRGVHPISVFGGLRMEGKIQTQKHGFPENFAPKNIGILHISYPKLWVKRVF